jgi:acetyl esterase/lipase
MRIRKVRAAEMTSKVGTQRICRLVLILVGVVVTGFCLLSTVARAQTPFYQASPQEIAGSPGTLIRQEPLGLPAPFGASVVRVLYRSQGLQGESISVSGIIVVPSGPAPPEGRPIVAWAHPTTGVVPRCAPSLAMFLIQQIQGVREMTRRGYIVAATDYPGLGTPETHPYLVGVSEARAVLDSVRVARTLTGAPNRFAVWGHSQGGQAALFTGLIAKTYAPELDLVGVAAAAPATDLGNLLAQDIDSNGGRNLTAMTLWSWSRVFAAPIDHVVDSAAVPTVNRLADECIESIYDILRRRGPTHALQQTFLSVKDFYNTEPWRSLMANNTPGALPSSLPVFLAQGGADDLVRPEVTRNYMNKLCRAGSKVQMNFIPAAGHGLIASDSALAAVQWMADRFDRRQAPSDCGS